MNPFKPRWRIALDDNPDTRKTFWRYQTASRAATERNRVLTGYDVPDLRWRVERNR